MENELYQRYVLSINEYRNMTKAAQALGISQPALSSGLNNLEKKLGFRLFNRRSKPIALTEEGMVYIEYIRQSQKILKEFSGRIADIHDNKNSELRVGAPVVYAESILTPAAAKLMQAYPQIRVVIAAGAFSELVERTISEELDLFISTSEDIPDSLVKIELGMEKLYLCIPGTWEINRKLQAYRITKEQEGECFDYKILKDCPFIMLGEKQPLQQEILRFLTENGLGIGRGVEVDQVALGIRMASLGSGIAIASEEALSCSKYTQELCVYPLPPSYSGRMLYLAYNEAHYLSNISRKYIELLKEGRADRQ